MSTSGISFSGMFSNLDTDSMIEQLLYIERAPVRLLENKQTKLELEKEELQKVNNSLLALKNSIKTFQPGGVSFDNTVSSSDKSIVTGSATVAATEGTYSIDVLNLAREQIIASAQQAGGWVYDGVGLDGTFTITTEDGAGPTFDITVTDGVDTLASIASKINNAVNGGDNFADYGSASLITDPGTGNQTLVIKADETGIEHKLDMVFSEGSTFLTDVGIRAPGLNEIQTALDANVLIDAVAVSSSTNVMEGAITGVTLNLHDADPGNPVTVSIGLNDDDFVTKITEFISRFNDSTDMLSKYIKERPVAKPRTQSELRMGVLSSDYDLVSTKSQIRMKTTGYVDGSLATYKIMAQIGITSERSVGSSVSNNIELDEDKLRAALVDDKDQVVQLLEGWADKLDTYLEAQTKVSVISSDAGNYYRRMLFIDERIDNIDDDIATWEDRLLSMEERMRYQFAAMEEALQKLQMQSSYLTAQLTGLMNASSR